MMISVTLLFLLVELCGCSNQSTTALDQRASGSVDQQVQKSSATISRILESPSISPFDIQQYVMSQVTGERLVEFAPIWKKLNIPRDEEGVFDGFIPSLSRWQAEVIPMSGSQDVTESKEEGRLTVLKLVAGDGASRRYIVFRLVGETKWQFSGYIDLLNNYAGSPDSEYHEMVVQKRNAWLVLRETPRLGTGISATNEMWFKIDQGNPKEDLKYPLEGSRVVGSVSDLEYRGTVLEPKVANGVLTQRVRYNVSFGVGPKPAFDWLFSKTVLAVFVRDQSSEAFKLAPMSEVSLEELNSKFGSPEGSEFIGYNFDRILNLATKATPEQKDWFGRAINEVSDSRKKASLVRALRLTQN